MNIPTYILISLLVLVSLAVSGCQEQTAPTEEVAGQPRVAIQQGVLRVDGKPFDIKGICWNPIPKGHRHPEGLAYRTGGIAYDLAFIERDLRLIAQAGFNTLRPYSPITDQTVLDLIDAYGLRVIVPIFNFHEISDDQIALTLATLENHPTSLFWEIGNEWNYNHLYNPQGNFEKAAQRIQNVITIIEATNSRLPIALNYGELPSKEVEQRFDVDLWGLNIYRSDSFDDVFERWQKLSDKPMYLGEYGADAIDNRQGDGRYAPAEQAHAVTRLTQLIMGSYASRGNGPLLGGALFEFSDEWWKDGKGSPDEHDIGGIAPGGGPYPDLEFNEEWWGIVDVDRTPRAAYHAMKQLYANRDS